MEGVVEDKGTMGGGGWIPRLYDRLRPWEWAKDHRAGATADPSRNPSSNRLGQPSSVCLYPGLAFISLCVQEGRIGMQTVVECLDGQIDSRIDRIGGSVFSNVPTALG